MAIKYHGGAGRYRGALKMTDMKMHGHDIDGPNCIISDLTLYVGVRRYEGWSVGPAAPFGGPDINFSRNFLNY